MQGAVAPVGATRVGRMTYKVHPQATSMDTATAPFAMLVGALKKLHYSSRFAASFVVCNGPESVERFVRAVRARLYRDRTTKGGPYLTSIMNALDPPHCRCGQPGTRRIGTQTFCHACGPTPRVKKNFRRYQHGHDAQSIDIAFAKFENDDRALGHQSLAATKRHRR